MVRPEVVDYLRENLSKFQAEDLRRQLNQEGVSDVDFDDSLVVARGNPKTVPSAPTKPAASERRQAVKLALFLGSGLLLLLGLTMLVSSKPGAGSQPAAATSTGETGYIGHAGWVVRLPSDYAAVSEFRDASKTVQTVYFCPRGTDPTSFIDTSLYGQLGIVRLVVAPSEFPPNPTGVARLSNAVSGNLRSEKFAVKNISIGTLPGVQANVLSPQPRVEAYILGQNEEYFFYGGQEDEIWRAIVLSLRDAHSEN